MKNSQSSYRAPSGGQRGTSAKTNIPAGSGSRPGGGKFKIPCSNPSNPKMIRG